MTIRAACTKPRQMKLYWVWLDCLTRRRKVSRILSTRSVLTAYATSPGAVSGCGALAPSPAIRPGAILTSGACLTLSRNRSKAVHNGCVRTQQPQTVGACQPGCLRLPAHCMARWRAVRFFTIRSFYVKCDDELNPPESRDLGRLIIEIGMSPVKPAEFVIFRVSQWAGPGSE
jgi:hypothetical protein